jgi:hypothetical protein
MEGVMLIMSETKIRIGSQSRESVQLGELIIKLQELQALHGSGAFVSARVVTAPSMYELVVESYEDDGVKNG